PIFLDIRFRNGYSPPMKPADVVQGATPTLNARASGSSSEHWLNLSFRALLPWSFEEIRVESGCLDDALQFISLHYSTLFGLTPDDDRWLEDPMTPAKRRFL